MQGVSQAEACIKSQIQGAELILAPIWGRDSEANEHWTLMALRVESREVRYYDSLNQEHQTCRTSAQELLSLLMPGKMLPERRNKARQPSGQLTCGLFSMYYMHEEMRFAMGQGWGTQGWPQISALSAKLVSFSAVLSKEVDAMTLDALKLKAVDEKKTSG